MKITAFLITYNCGPFLADCINSINGQIRKPDTVVIVDDGSTDNSREVINSTFAEFPKMYIFSEHQGIQAQRTAALRMAEGFEADAVIFLDADAIYFPHYLSQLVAALERNPEAGFSYCRWNWVREQDGHRFAQNSPATFDLNRLKRSNFISMCSLVRRSMFEGFQFDPELPRFHDWSLWLHCALIKHKIGAFVPETLFEAKLRANGLTMKRGGAGGVALEVLRRKYNLERRSP